MNYSQLIKEAFLARERSYSPYSNFSVGAALLASNGTIYRGCNIENSSFTPTNCAERTAFFTAVSEGVSDFDVIVIVGGKKGEAVDFCSPCGVCRQVMMEFCNPKTFQVILARSEEEYKEFTLEELLPFGFSPKELLVTVQP